MQKFYSKLMELAESNAPLLGQVNRPNSFTLKKVFKLLKESNPEIYIDPRHILVNYFERPISERELTKYVVNELTGECNALCKKEDFIRED
jgi:hypothetical protein